MSTSGTYAWQPSLGTLTLNAFQRLQIRPAAITAQHLQDASFEANMMQADWAADGITWWSVIEINEPLFAGVATYAVPPHVISVLDVVVNNGSSNRLILPFSRTDYASLATPTQQGFPTSFWYDRALNPTLNFWPVPDNTSSYTLKYYAYAQTEDATFGNGANPAVPLWWLDAYVAGLAHRLSRMWAPDQEAKRMVDAEKAYARACKQVEPAPIYITPGLAGYFR